MAGNKKTALKNLSKAQAKNKGRPPGAKNKRTADVLSVINSAHNSLIRAKKDLSVQAKSDPKWFYEKIWSKIIPKDVQIGLELGEAMMSFMAKMKHKEKHGAPGIKDN